MRTISGVIQSFRTAYLIKRKHKLKSQPENIKKSSSCTPNVSNTNQKRKTKQNGILQKSKTKPLLALTQTLLTHQPPPFENDKILVISNFTHNPHPNCTPHNINRVRSMTQPKLSKIGHRINVKYKQHSKPLITQTP